MLIWHPYQKLWNKPFLRFLKKAIPNDYLRGKLTVGIIFTDSFLLSLRKTARAIKRKKKYSSLAKMTHVQVNYFDVGTHKKGREISNMVDKLLDKNNLNYDVYAFEASPSMYIEAKNALKSYPKVSVVNIALCAEIPEGRVIRLYKTEGGLGNSVFGADSQDYEEAPAARLSEFIRKKNINLKNSVNILRMNIEGAEFGVLKDLVENDIHKYFNGLYGMWDDLEKMPDSEQEAVKKLLRENNISPFTFNGRDLRFPQRLKLIIGDIKSAILMGPLDKGCQ